MKKKWTNPVLENLAISETAGGRKYDPNPDEATWTPEDGYIFRYGISGDYEEPPEQ